MKRSPPIRPDRPPPRLAILLAAALAAATTAATGATAGALETGAWKTRQPLHVDTPGIVSFAVPPATLDAARPDHGDLRIVDPAGREVAFALVRPARAATRTLAAKSFRSSLSATATQLVIESPVPEIEEIALETPATGFLKRARVETSPDGVTWTLADDGGPLFRQSGAERLSVRSNAPFVRVTLDDTRSRPVPFTAARVTVAAPPVPPAPPLGATIARREQFAGETVLTLELAAAHVPLDTLTFSTPERLFTRRVAVGVRELREDAAVERLVVAGTIFNFGDDGGPRRAVLSVRLGFTPPSRELIVHVANGDSPPLALTEVQVTRTEVTCRFDAATAGEYTLWSGNERADPPRYDVASIRVAPTAPTPAVRLGALESNPAYRPVEVLAGTPLLGAALDPAPWAYRKAVQLTTAGVHQLELDLDVLVHAQAGFGDLRLLRDGTQVPYLLERPGLSRSLDLTVTPAPDPKRPRTSRWEVALPRPALPITRLVLQSPAPLFQRQLRLHEVLVDDRGNHSERTLATAGWSRTPEETAALVLPLGSPPATGTLYLETDNGDNPPLALGPVRAEHAVTRLLFKSDAAPVALYYGHRQASPPRYDLALVAGRILSAEKLVATLGPEEPLQSAGWTRTLLGGGRSGAIFWAMLALVVIALLVLVAKLLPKPPGTSG